MASLKYGCLDPAPKTKMYPVAADQYFYHNGVNAVYLDGNGRVSLALTATATLLGIAIPPKGYGAAASSVTTYWKSSATAGEDEIPVILAKDGYDFLLPADATVTESMKGNACDLISVNDGTATQVDVGTSSTDVFIIQDLGTNEKSNAAATDVVVEINPAKIQADT